MDADAVNTDWLRELLAKATPGPWTVRLSGMRGSFHIPEAATHEAENACVTDNDGHDVSSANARLIAGLIDSAATLLDNTDRLAALEAGMREIREGSRFQSSDGAWTYIVPQAVIDALLNRPADGGE